MFQIGAKRYMVRIMEDTLKYDGEEVMGLCDEGAREIKLSPKVAIDERIDVLLHEVAHAHVFGTGFPANVESLCDLMASVGRCVIKGLVIAGGIEALKQLRPGERLGDASGRMGHLRHRICKCGGKIAAGDVHCERERRAPDRVKISAYCDHCNITLQWVETCSLDGLPTGIVVGDVEVVTGRALPSMQPSGGAAESSILRELRYVSEQYL